MRDTRAAGVTLGTADLSLIGMEAFCGVVCGHVYGAHDGALRNRWRMTSPAGVSVTAIGEEGPSSLLHVKMHLVMVAAAWPK